MRKWLSLGSILVFSLWVWADAPVRYEVKAVSVHQTGPDEGDNRHPSGKDRSEERGKSGTQGKAKSDPDGAGEDKQGFDGGLDKGDQDNNNGCGNDDDFEDDNNGKCLGRLAQAEVAPSPTPVPTAVPTPTAMPTPTSTPSPTSTPTPAPTAAPTPAPTAAPVAGQVLGGRLPPTGGLAKRTGWILKLAAVAVWQVALVRMGGKKAYDA